MNGSQSDNSAPLAGAPTFSCAMATAWSQQAYLKASNSDAGDFFGAGCGAAGDTAVVGVIGEVAAPQAIDGDESKQQRLIGAGAAYVLRLTAPLGVSKLI